MELVMIYHSATADFVTNYADALRTLDISLRPGNRTPAEQRTAMSLLRACKRGAKEVVAMNWNNDTHIFFAPHKALIRVLNRPGFVQVAEHFDVSLEQVDLMDPTSIQWDYVSLTDVLSEKLAAALLSGEDHE